MCPRDNLTVSRFQNLADDEEHTEQDDLWQRIKINIEDSQLTINHQMYEVRVSQIVDNTDTTDATEYVSIRSIVRLIAR